MAKAPTPPPADKAANPGKSKKVLLIVLIILLVLVLVAVGLVGFLLLKKTSASGEPESATTSAEVRPPPPPPAPYAVDLSKPPAFFALDPFIVNLASGEGDRYLQAVLALRVADTKTADGLKAFTPEIRHRINLLLASKLPSEISTLEGREALANQIGVEINTVLGYPPPPEGTRLISSTGGPVQAVLFNSFIIQ